MRICTILLLLACCASRERMAAEAQVRSVYTEVMADKKESRDRHRQLHIDLMGVDHHPHAIDSGPCRARWHLRRPPNVVIGDNEDPEDEDHCPYVSRECRRCFRAHGYPQPVEHSSCSEE